MMVDLGFAGADDAYVRSLMGSFGRFDGDHDGLISLEEFGVVYDFLGGDGRFAETADEPASSAVESKCESKPIAIKPANLVFEQGTAVIVEGLTAAPEWNGKRGLVQSHDAATGRYQLLMKGRKNALGVKFERCKLELVAEEEERAQEATRRARVEADVRAVLVARELEPEPEPISASEGKKGKGKKKTKK